MTTATLPAQASISTASGWTVTVTCAGREHGSLARARWAYCITAAAVTGENGHAASMEWIGNDLTTYTGTYGEPNPMVALESLGSFLYAYAEAWQYDTDTSDNRSLFPSSLPAGMAEELADAIALMYGDRQACDDCHAGPGEPCHVDCSSRWGE